MSTGKLEVDFPGDEAPAGLEITEIWEGDGKVARPATRSRLSATPTSCATPRSSGSRSACASLVSGAGTMPPRLQMRTITSRRSFRLAGPAAYASAFLLAGDPS